MKGVFGDLQDLRRAVWVFPSLLHGGFYRPQHWQIITKVGDEVRMTAIAAVGDDLEGEARKLLIIIKINILATTTRII